MARPYSDDLRSKLLDAYEAGCGSLKELAGQFGVSWGYSKKVRAQQLRNGCRERTRQLRHGPASRLTPLVEEKLRAALRRQPDLTLAELRQYLYEKTGVPISRSRLWVWLQRLGLRHKKNPFAHRSRTAGKTSGGGRRGGNR
jgi:transposase